MFEVASFTHPWLFLLVLLPLLLPVLYWHRGIKKRNCLFLSSFDWVPAAAANAARIPGRAIWLRVMALICLIPPAAGISTLRTVPVAAGEPEALVIVLDTSSSMTAEDFPPGSRLETAKKLLSEFASVHSASELGLILLSASPKLAVPVTAERGALALALHNASSAGFEEDGTALGSGIASAVNRLRNVPWLRRRILLVTDGVNNRGALAPSDAARIAAQMGIRVDTIGIGTDTVSRYWVPAPQGAPVEVKARIEIDDRALEEVARITGGRYFRVMNTDQLRRALAALREGSQPASTSTHEQEDYLSVQVLALACVLLICLEFLWTRFIGLELPE